jgi:hypothetical protein
MKEKICLALSEKNRVNSLSYGKVSVIHVNYISYAKIQRTPLLSYEYGDSIWIVNFIIFCIQLEKYYMNYGYLYMVTLWSLERK